MNEERVKEIIELFSKEMNSGYAHSEDVGKLMAHEFMNDHRTLQQSMARALFYFFKEVSENNRADDRNAGSLKWIKSVAELDGEFPFI